MSVGLGNFKFGGQKLVSWPKNRVNNPTKNGQYFKNEIGSNIIVVKNVNILSQYSNPIFF